MNERVIQFRVGVVVVAATIITGIMIMLFGEGKTLVRSQYTIFLLFPQTPGVTVDTPVRKHGVLIGRVSAVELRDEGGVRLTARIDANRRLRRSEVCLIKTASLLGDAVLEFVPTSRPDEPPDFVQDGDTIADGAVASNPLEVITDLKGTMESAIASVESAADEFEQLARSLNQTLGDNDDRIGRIIRKSEEALDKFSDTMTTIDEFAGDPRLRNDLRRSLERVPALFDDVEETLSIARNAMSGFEEVSTQARRNLRNIEQLTRPLGERGGQLADDISTTAGNLAEITNQLVTFTEAINDREGSLGLFIHDRQLYDRFDQAILNINKASWQIRPILDDVRTFTDKIARDPRQLGVKGALDRKPLGLGLK